MALSFVAAAVPWAAVNAQASFTGALQFDADGKFTVMQLTDIQTSTSLSSRITTVITKAIARYKPDLVVLTGDNIMGLMSKSSAQSVINAIVAPMVNTNTKFAVTFGNHDNDKFIVDPGTTDEQYVFYKNAGAGNFIDHDVASLTGAGNGVIPIYPNGQTSGTPAYQVYLMDSNDNASSGSYDCPYTNQVDYYIQQSQARPGVPSLWFQHIIVPDIYTRCMTQDASGRYGQSSPFSSYEYILTPSQINWARCSSTNISDIYQEGPCPANQSLYEAAAHRSSATYGSKTLYEAWAAYGNLKGAYFGHDHLNEFTMTTQEGIDLGYGESTGLTPMYNDNNPGVSIYQLSTDGSYTNEFVDEAKLNKVMITFDPNGGIGEMPAQYIPTNSTAALQQNLFEKPNYDFAGWATTPGGSVVYSNLSNITVGTADITLYAKWNLRGYMMTFNANGGTGGTSTVMLPGEPLSAPEVARTGYTFAGWSPEVPATVPSSNKTFTAQWTPNEYTVTYLANGGEGTTADSAHVYDTAANLTANGYTRTGYNFLGWAASQDAEAAEYTDAQSVVNLASDNGAIVSFYAVWSRITHTMSFQSNGGTAIAPVSAYYGTVLDEPAEKPARTGYRFNGWFANQSLTQEVNWPVTLTADVTFYASWSLESYLITFNANGGQNGSSGLMSYGAALSAPTVTRPGYVFNGWQPQVPPTVGAADAVYTAQWVMIPLNLETADGSSTVIDNQNGYIYGLQTGINVIDFENQFVRINGNGRLNYLVGSSFGTGTVVQLVNNANEEIVASYTIVIFGDVNGDGNIDSADADILVDVENWIVEWPAGSENYLAGDINGDGNIDSGDAGILVDVENFWRTINQTTGRAE